MLNGGAFVARGVMSTHIHIHGYGQACDYIYILIREQRRSRPRETITGWTGPHRANERAPRVWVAFVMISLSRSRKRHVNMTEMNEIRIMLCNLHACGDAPLLLLLLLCCINDHRHHNTLRCRKTLSFLYTLQDVKKNKPDNKQLPNELT